MRYARLMLILALGMALPPPAAWAAPLAPADRAAILADTAAYAPRLSRTALAIWHDAELGFHEERSSARLQAELRAAGFSVTAGVAGMPTAFVARYRTGPGPVIGFLAEYDALPGMSQAAGATRAPEPGMADGHACGHNLFGAASVAAAIATRRWMAAAGVKGEVRLYGSPAEEGGSGKVFLVRAGLMDDVDAVLHWHPSDTTGAAQGRSLANISGKFRFHGIAAHAALAPERGRSALDAVEAMDMMVNMMREHVPQETRIHYVITDGGKAPNVVPASAEVYYYIRHPDQAEVKAIFARVMDAAKGAALGTGTTVTFAQTGGSFNLLPNDTLGRLLDATLRSLPPIRRTEADERLMADLAGTLPADRSAPAAGVAPYRLGELYSVSTDVGDVSHAAPTAGLTVQTWAPGTPAHSWQAVAASGAGIGVAGAETAAEALALSAAALFRDPATLAAAKAEFLRRRGPGFVYRSLLGDQPPQLEYRKGGG